MTSLESRPTGPGRSNVNDAFLRSKIEKLEKRLKHQRAAGKTLDPNSILMVMNDRVVCDMETKLFKLKRAAGPPGAVWPAETNAANHSP